MIDDHQVAVPTVAPPGIHHHPIIDRPNRIASIPGDIYPVAEDELRVTFLDPASSESIQAEFDLVVLSVGMTPCDGMAQTAEMLKLPLADTGFAKQIGAGGLTPENGIFTAGAVTGPMSIPESIASAGKTVFDVAKYLGLNL